MRTELSCVGVWYCWVPRNGQVGNFKIRTDLEGGYKPCALHCFRQAAMLDSTFFGTWHCCILLKFECDLTCHRPCIILSAAFILRLPSYAAVRGTTRHSSMTPLLCVKCLRTSGSKPDHSLLCSLGLNLLWLLQICNVVFCAMSPCVFHSAVHSSYSCPSIVAV